MEAKTESPSAVKPCFQSPLAIALGVSGKGTSLAVPSVAFDAKSLAKTDLEFPEYTNDPEDSKVHLTHGHEDHQIEAQAADETAVIDESNLDSYVGKPPLYEHTPIGVAIGLAMASVDGLAWYVKTIVVKEGEAIGSVNVIGQVGIETYRSACTAYKVAQQILLCKQPGNTFFTRSNLHVHTPTAKGTSAGCTIGTSLLSLAMKKSVRKDLAMTGEITPTGRILPIGDVKEKTIGARRIQVKNIILPEGNRREFDDLPVDVKAGLNVHFVDEYEQIFELAFNYDN